MSIFITLATSAYSLLESLSYFACYLSFPALHLFFRLAIFWSVMSPLFDSGCLRYWVALWDWVASAYSDLKQDFSSPTRDEVRPQQWEHWILTTRPHRPVVSDKCLLEGKRVCVNRLMGVDLDRELNFYGSWSHLYGAFLPGFPWSVTLLCLALSLYLVYSRILPWVRVHLLAKMGSREKACGWTDITYYGWCPLLLWPLKRLYAHV